MTTNNEKKCALCKMREADKTNSHLIPDFLVKRVASVDDKPDRDKELLSEIYDRGVTRGFATRDVDSGLLRKFFVKPLKEIREENNKTIVVKDYIFCNECEKRLSKFLESPYADTLVSNKKKDEDMPYFFWLSIIWRISKFRILQIDLPTHIVESMGKRLNAYLKAKNNNEDLSHIMCNLPFDYSVIYCKDFSLYGNGGILAEYDKKEKTFLLILGDFILYVYFSKHKRLRLADRYGLADVFANTPTYKEQHKEQRLNVTSEVFKCIYERVVQMFQEEYIQGREQMINFLWFLMSLKNDELPIIPSDNFLEFVRNKLYFGNARSGEKARIEFVVRTFCDGLKKIYGIEISE